MPRFSPVLSRALIFSFLAILLGACASKQPKVLSEKEYYETAQKSMRSGNFTKASDNLESLESHYPVGVYTDQAQLELIYAKFRHADHAGAAAAADRFIRLHPNHPQVDYAYYIRGLADYEADRDFLARYLPVKAPARDLANLRDAFGNFRELLTRFPDSAYAPDARARMIYIRNQLAESEMHVARFYAKKKAYLSALNRARAVVENFPGAPQTPEAIALQVWAYGKLGMKDLAEGQLALLKTNYPSYAGLEALARELGGSGKRSWVNVATFGLFGDSGR
ncbi:MAG: competence protein ComL [Moraxellaceae bacterium]|jgi:outer membrane protein assembly factor BamD|nr:competence protein ComL [Moraxellaceae bacterium]